MSIPPAPPRLQYELVTPPQEGFHTPEGWPIMLAACGGGPGMSADYLRDLVAPFPSLLVDWARVDAEGHPLRGDDLGVGAQANYLELCRQHVASELSCGDHLCLIPIAHSAAGPRCVSWAAHYPEWVAGLVLLDAVIGPPRLPYSAITLFLGLWRYRLRHRASWEEAFRARFMPLVGRYYFSHPTPELEAAFIRAFISPFWDLLLKSGFATSDVRELLKTLRVPILFLHGALDQMVLPEQTKQQQQALEGLGVSATLRLIPGAGHLPMLERPLGTAGALREFLQTVVSLP